MISTLKPSRDISVPFRFSLDQYDNMIEAGILDEGDAVELLDGVIYYKGRWRNNSPVRCRFSLDQYHKMIAAGILDEDDPVEFYNGEVQPIMPQGDPHGICLEKLSRLLSRLLSDEIAVRCQLPITIGEEEPEPDLVICTSPEQRGERHPAAKDIHIVMEVSETSLKVDRRIKQAIYADHKLKAFWIVNIKACKVEVYTKPDSAHGKYRSRVDYGKGEVIPIVVDGQTIVAIPVDSIFTYAKKKS